MVRYLCGFWREKWNLLGVGYGVALRLEAGAGTGEKLQQAEQEKAILWSDLDGYKAKSEQLEQELKALPAKVIKEYEDKNKAKLQAGDMILTALKDTDFASRFAVLCKEYRAEQQLKRKLREQEQRIRTRDRARQAGRTKGRDRDNERE